MTHISGKNAIKNIFNCLKMQRYRHDLNQFIEFLVLEFEGRLIYWGKWVNQGKNLEPQFL